MSLTVSELSNRSLSVFRELIEAFIETGEPVGSRTLSRRLKNPLSPATIRNVMADLEETGLLYAPYTSAGRLPTEAGLRFFVDGLLEIGDLSLTEQHEIERRCAQKGTTAEHVLEEASSLLSGLSCCAGLVMAPKIEMPLKHIEFVSLSANRILAVLIAMDGTVENRIIDSPESLYPGDLQSAGQYLTAKIYGRTLEEARIIIAEEMRCHEQSLNALASRIVELGLGVWAGDDPGAKTGAKTGPRQAGSLIIKGQSHLLDSVTEIQDLQQIKSLFHLLETKETLDKLIQASIQAEGVQIFIGSETSLFQLSGCSMVVSPYHNTQNKIIGAIGVIGPSRMNYGRIIPLVDFTAKIVGKIVGGS